MRYAFLAVFALVFGGIVYAAQTVDSFIGTEKVCAISQTSCGVSSSEAAEKESEMEPGRPPGVPGIAQPKLKGVVRYGTAVVPNRQGTCHSGCYVVGNCRTWTYWQPMCYRPVRNVVCFFHNRRPVRRTLGFLFCGGCR